MSQNLEYQVRQNTIALQRIIDEAKKFSELEEELSTLSGDELVAIEKNGVTKSVRSNMIGGVNGYIGNIPSTFKTATIDFDDPIGTPITKVRDFINAMPNHVILNGYAQWFKTFRAVLTNGSGLAVPSGGGASFAVIVDYYVLSGKIPPIAGVTSIGVGGTQITTADLMKFHTSDSRSTEPVEFDLGDIASDEIWDAVDNTGPRSVPNTVTNLFRAIQGGTEKIWLYIGGQEEVGVGYPVTDAGDYREISSDGSGMDPAPPATFTYFIYDDIDELLIRRHEQTSGDLILVQDAVDDTNITWASGETRRQAMYRLKPGTLTATPTASLTDYLLVAVPYGNGGGAFDPSDYDLDEFNNAGQDPYVRNSEIPAPTLQEVIDKSANGGDYVYASFPSGNQIEDDGGGLTLKGDIAVASANGDELIIAKDSGTTATLEGTKGNNGDFLVNVDGNGRVGWRKLLDDTVTSLTKLWSSQKISDELASKVDKEVGKGLSQENYTTAEKNKLAGLESSKWRGLYLTKTALELANPTPEGGDYADVDAGAGTDTIRYVYDETDDDWIESGSGSPLTGAQIKVLYEGEPDTNAFTDSLKSWLQGMSEQFTTALKNAYDNVVTWISTNGQNVLDHINSPHAPANAQKNSDITSNEITNSLGYIPENLERKVSNLLFPDDFDYPTTKAVADELDKKQVKELDYGTIALMLAGQANQSEGQTIRVDDASADTNLIFPTGANKVAYYKYNGVAGSPASIADYTLISAPYATMKAWQVVRDVNYTITPALYGHDIFIDDGITTFNPNTQAYQDNFEVLLINTSGERRSISLVAKTGVTYMVNGVSETSITFQIETAGAIGIFRKLGTNTYIIRGQIV